MVEPERYTVATGAKTIVVFEGVTVVGEALVPSGRKAYTDALVKGDNSFFVRSAKAQKRLGAKIVNINVNTPGVDEIEAMKTAVKSITKRVDIPLQIDSTNHRVIEEALRIYPGKAVVNSVNGTEQSMSKILPLVKKYGACVIGMPFDERGIKGGVVDRVNVAEKIVSRARECGIEKRDIIIDCLSLSAISHQKDLVDTLTVVKEVKENLGVKTMLGVANVSYGLPGRRIMDRTYFAMALARGLDVVMMSLYENDMVETLDAYNVIADVDEKAKKYRRKYKIY